MKNPFILISLALLLINITLIIVSLSVPTWSLVDNSKRMSLMSCVDCEPIYSDYNFECLARTYCQSDTNLGSCKVNTNLYKSGYSFIILEVFSMIMALLFLEKQVIMLLKYDYGHSALPYVFGSLMIAFHLLGTILWITLSQAKFTSCSSTSDFYSTPQVCAKDGPKVAIANIILMTASMTLFVFASRKHPVLHIESSVTFRKIVWIKGRVWLYIILVLLLISYALVLTSLTISRWVSDGSEISGSLTRCSNCDQIENLAWQCLAGKECTTDSTSSNCKLYKRLSTASKVFIVLEIISLTMFIFLAQSVSTFMKEHNYGFFGFNYAYAIIPMVLNLVACGLWFGISSAKLSGSGLVALDGASLSVASQFFVIPLGVIFCVVYRFRSVNFYDKRSLNKTVIEKPVDLSIVNNTMTESPKKIRMPNLEKNN